MITADKYRFTLKDFTQVVKFLKTEYPILSGFLSAFICVKCRFLVQYFIGERKYA